MLTRHTTTSLLLLLLIVCAAGLDIVNAAPKKGGRKGKKLEVKKAEEEVEGRFARWWRWIKGATIVSKEDVEFLLKSEAIDVLNERRDAEAQVNSNLQHYTLALKLMQMTFLAMNVEARVLKKTAEKANANDELSEEMLRSYEVEVDARNLVIDVFEGFFLKKVNTEIEIMRAQGIADTDDELRLKLRRREMIELDVLVVQRSAVASIQKIKDTHDVAANNRYMTSFGIAIGVGVIVAIFLLLIAMQCRKLMHNRGIKGDHDRLAQFAN